MQALAASFVRTDGGGCRWRASALPALPACQGEEVTGAVIDGPQSVAWVEAEIHLHTQKALMEFLLLGEIGEIEEWAGASQEPRA